MGARGQRGFFPREAIAHTLAAMSTGGELEGRSALVTGGGRGLGRSIARTLGAAGARVALLARTREQVEEAARELSRAGSAALALTADVSVPGQVAAAVDEVERAWGGIDILVNNAGVLGPAGPAHEADPETWLRAVRVNLGGCFICCRAVLPGMIARRRGGIVNLSGGGAVSPRPWFSAYGAAKAGVVRFTETLAAEVAPHGVRVNAVAPGALRTDMAREAADALRELGRAEAGAAPGASGATPEGAAELVLYLVSPRSAGLSGRLLSAVWDDWEHLDVEAVMAGEGGAVRRLKP